VLGNREKTLDMTPAEYNSLISAVDFEKLYWEHTNRDYFIPLMNKLRKDV
jgi:hypothetical protein